MDRLLTRLGGAALLVATYAASTVAPTTAPAMSITAPAPDTGAGIALSVDGTVANPLTLSRHELRESYPGHRVRVSYESAEGTETHVYRGALLLDVLVSAEPTFDPAIKNDKLRYAVRGSASSDGYAAVVSWGELDPDYAANTILVAYREDDAKLGATELRLVVPGDVRGGRYVSGVDELTLSKVGS